MAHNAGAVIQRGTTALLTLGAAVVLTAAGWRTPTVSRPMIGPTQPTFRTFAPAWRPDASHEQVLFTFQLPRTGLNPYGGLYMDASGALYGTTQHGGSVGYGTVFKLTPSGATYNESLLYAFKGGSDGQSPLGGVAADSKGNLYGTTYYGGSATCNGGCGIVFKLTRSGTKYKESVVYTFHQTDGSNPQAGLYIDKTGVLYGTTTYGGGFGYGMVYKLTPGGSGYAETTAYSFRGSPDGGYPNARVFVDTAGTVYGTTSYGGVSNAGLAFKLTPSGSFYAEHIIHEFTGPDGEYPECRLVRDSAGALYGTTRSGGASSGGTVFKLTPAGSHYTESVLHSFGKYPDGYEPEFGLSIDTAGALYGVTIGGGAFGWGTVFKLTPAGAVYNETILHGFVNGNTDGASPSSALLSSSTGVFYGTTSAGGVGPNANSGTVYRLTP